MGGWICYLWVECDDLEDEFDCEEDCEHHVHDVQHVLVLRRLIVKLNTHQICECDCILTVCCLRQLFGQFRTMRESALIILISYQVQLFHQENIYFSELVLGEFG